MGLVTSPCPHNGRSFRHRLNYNSCRLFPFPKINSGTPRHELLSKETHICDDTPGAKSESFSPWHLALTTKYLFQKKKQLYFIKTPAFFPYRLLKGD